MKLYGSKAAGDILKTLFEACGYRVVDVPNYAKTKRTKAQSVGKKVLRPRPKAKNRARKI